MEGEPHGERFNSGQQPRRCCSRVNGLGHHDFTGTRALSVFDEESANALVSPLLLSPIAGEDLCKEEWRVEKSIPFCERLFTELLRLHHTMLEEGCHCLFLMPTGIYQGKEHFFVRFVHLTVID